MSDGEVGDVGGKVGFDEVDEMEEADAWVTGRGRICDLRCCTGADDRDDEGPAVGTDDEEDTDD